MLSLSDITLTFPDGDGRVTAVDRAALEVADGTVAGLTGPSGSGKSSLLAVASTLVRPDAGTVRIAGIDATALSQKEAARLRREKIGIVFQQSNLLPSLTAREQLLVMGEMDGARSGRAARRRAADELLDVVGLGDHRDARPAALSGGQRQRINIARALMGDPNVLIVDEPTSALDRARSEEIIELVIDLTRDLDTATLLVTHDLQLMPRFDATYEMIDGRLAPVVEATHTVV
ncbi:putative ABC transport system ATP-binding protein [Brevibacterium sp. Mu109]|uniref:ABC transporter ATP-binding protein n=1 Tax=Brevibacterium sp. Mu109 TaxID=1255669 RepID=UPI000C6435C7|nr:ABC transporter ATP-binding protein [Brevibacterium sp. Mu109]SMX64837.1 putative ABC transport system ATP-binding protein [Brevibacterium sp. Mu109]